MILIGPFAFFCLLCVLLLFFRPVRLLAGSVLLTILVIAARYVGANPGEHVDLAATILVTQVIYWALVIASGASRRKRHAQEIANAINIGLARHGIAPQASQSLYTDDQKKDARRALLLAPLAVGVMAIPALALMYCSNHAQHSAIPTEITLPSPPEPVTAIAQTHPPKKHRKQSSAPSGSSVPSSASAVVMPMADPSPGAEPPQ